MANVLSEQGGHLDAEQKKVVRQILNVGRRSGASPRDLVVALVTGLQESGLRNLSIGAETSGGWRQERAIYYPDPTNVKHSAERFFKELHERGGSGSIGEEAQATQRSAYPDAYQPHVAEARQILKEFGGAKSGGKTAAMKQRALGGKQGTSKVVGGGIDKNSQAYKAAALEFIKNQGQPGALESFMAAKEMLTSPQKVVSTEGASGGKKKQAGESTGGHPNSEAASTKGLANFEGTKVAAWIKPYLVYARQHGWKGTVNSGYRSYAEQKRIYESGVRPAAVPGTSNHEGTSFPRGAVDVSEAEQLSQILQKKPGGSALKWAGSKDPVHFSHPHNGSY